MIRLSLVAVLACVSACAQTFPMPGPNSPHPLTVAAVIGPIDIYTDMNTSAISRTGSCSAATTSCTFSATKAGDLKIVFAYRNNSVTAPTLPAGWTSIDTQATAAGGTTGTFRIGCNVSSSTTDTGTGTWTNASDVVAVSYFGTRASTTSACNTTGIGGKSQNNAKTSTTANFPTVTMTDGGGTSWVAGFVGNSAGGLCAPSGMSSVTTIGAGPAAQANDTNGTVSSWSSTNCTVTSSTWMTEAVEILGAPTGTTITAGMLTNGMLGGSNASGWAISTTPLAGVTVSAHQSGCSLLGSVQVNGTNYPIGHSSQSISYDNSQTTRTFKLATPIGYFNGTFFGCITFGPSQVSAGSAVLFDYVVLFSRASAKYCALQLNNGNAAGSTYGVNIETNPGGVTTHSAYQTITPGGTYFVSFNCNFRAGTGQLQVYDTTGSQVGSTINATAAATTGTDDLTELRLGNNETGTNAATSKFENLLLQYSGGAVSPIGPSNTTLPPVYFVSKAIPAGSTSGSSTTTASGTMDVQAGNTIVACWSSENDASTVSGMADTAGNTYVSDASCKNTYSTHGRAECWYAKNTTANSSNAVTATHTASTFRDIFVAQYAGASTSAPLDVCATAQSSTTDLTSASFTPSTANGTALMYGYITAATAMLPGTNYDLFYTSASTSFAAEQRTSAPNSSQTSTLATTDASPKFGVTIVLKP